MKKKITIINILVLGFYLFHALSPLLYIVENAQAEEGLWGNQQDFILADYRSLAAEQNLLLKPSPGEEENPSSSPASRVLLKKKRALPASFKNIIEKLSLRYAKLFECEPPSEIALDIENIAGDNPNCPNGFQFYHSGTSPPSA